MKDETKFGQRVDRYLKRIPNSHWYNIQQVAIRGTPDRLGVINGYFVALELKAEPKAKHAKLQVYELKQIQGAGGFACFLYPENFAIVMDELESLNT